MSHWSPASGSPPLQRSCSSCGNRRPTVALRDGRHASRGAPSRGPGPFGRPFPAAGGRRRGDPAGRRVRQPRCRDSGVAPDGPFRRQRRVGYGRAAGDLPGRAGGRVPARGAAGALRRPAAAPRAAAGGRCRPGGVLAERRRDAAGVRAAGARPGPGRGVLDRGHRADRLAARRIRAARPRLRTGGRSLPDGRGRVRALDCRQRGRGAADDLRAAALPGHRGRNHRPGRRAVPGLRSRRTVAAFPPRRSSGPRCSPVSTCGPRRPSTSSGTPTPTTASSSWTTAAAGWTFPARPPRGTTPRAGAGSTPNASRRPCARPARPASSFSAPRA